MTEDDLQSVQWSQLAQSLWVVIWTSFLAASLATMVFFAAIDPLALSCDGHMSVWTQSRLSGYTIGFFFFWCTCMVAAGLTAFLLYGRRAKTLEV